MGNSTQITDVKGPKAIVTKQTIKVIEGSKISRSTTASLSRQVQDSELMIESSNSLIVLCASF